MMSMCNALFSHRDKIEANKLFASELKNAYFHGLYHRQDIPF